MSPTATGYSLTLGGKSGWGGKNPSGWNTTLTSRTTAQNETPGAIRIEGANQYVYAYLTGSINYAGVPCKLATSTGDSSGNVSPICLKELGATAAGYNSAFAITVQSTTGGVYAWFMQKGFATLPINTDTGAYAFGAPIAPSSSSAVWAICAAASGIGRVLTIDGDTPATATVAAQGGYFCYFDCTKQFN